MLYDEESIRRSNINNKILYATNAKNSLINNKDHAERRLEKIINEIEQYKKLSNVLDEISSDLNSIGIKVDGASWSIENNYKSDVAKNKTIQVSSIVNAEMSRIDDRNSQGIMECKDKLKKKKKIKEDLSKKISELKSDGEI